MPSSILRHASFDGRLRLAPLWLGLAAGPLAWATLLETNYVLSYVACEQRTSWMLHLATATALGIVGVAALLAWRAAPRARGMAMAALTLCGFFAIAILATEIPVLVLQPCTP